MGALSDEEITGSYSCRGEDIPAYHYAQKRRYRYIVSRYSRSIFWKYSFLNNRIYRSIISIFIGLIVGSFLISLEVVYSNPITGFYFDNVLGATLFFLFGWYLFSLGRRWVYREYVKCVFRSSKGLNSTVALDRSHVSFVCEGMSSSYAWSVGDVEVEVWRGYLIILHPITVLFIPARAFSMPLTEVASTINGWLPPRS